MHLPNLTKIAQNPEEDDSFVEAKKPEKDNEGGAVAGDRASMDEELQFILENFEFTPELADDVIIIYL
jgi:hypothetical protein